MNVEFVHRMPSLNEAFQAVLRVDQNCYELVCGSGLVLLIGNDGSANWYFYVDLRNPSSEEKARILRIMDEQGVRTDQRVNDLLRNPQFGDCFSGDAAQIANDLGSLGSILKYPI